MCISFTECDSQSSCKRCSVHRRWAADRDWPLHVRTSGHGHTDWGEGRLSLSLSLSDQFDHFPLQLCKQLVCNTQGPIYKCTYPSIHLIPMYLSLHLPYPYVLIPPSMSLICICFQFKIRYMYVCIFNVFVFKVVVYLSLCWSFVAQLVEHGACNARVVGLIPGTSHM